MQIKLLCVGKTENRYLIDGISQYTARLKHYIKFNLVEIPALKSTKNLSEVQQKSKEAELILKNISPTDYICLLDERGKEFTSESFASHLNTLFHKSKNTVVFIIGGPYGFDDSLLTRANEKIALSTMTFSHQMVRLFFIEQLYRACTILKGEPYHHS